MLYGIADVTFTVAMLDVLAFTHKNIEGAIYMKTISFNKKFNYLRIF